VGVGDGVHISPVSQPPPSPHRVTRCPMRAENLPKDMHFNHLPVLPDYSP